MKLTKGRIFTVALAVGAVALLNRFDQGRKITGVDGGGWF